MGWMAWALPVFAGKPAPTSRSCTGVAWSKTVVVCLQRVQGRASAAQFWRPGPYLLCDQPLTAHFPPANNRP